MLRLEPRPTIEMEAKTEGKSVQCSTCNRRFSRTDHLKRHQLRHSGVKPYSCIFCDEAYTRSDNLRDHYPGCSERRNRQIPEAARGGRRSHACDSCTSMKLGCDGNHPCKKCRQKQTECKFSRLEAKGAQMRGGSLVPQMAKDSSSSSDRGSINFLLNSGTASFIESFQFPASNERRNLFTFRNGVSNNDPIPDLFGSNSEKNRSMPSFPESLSSEPIDWAMFEDENLLRFLDAPYNEVQTQSEDLLAPVYVESNYITSATITGVQVPEQWETPSTQSSAIVQGVMEKAIALQLTPQEQANVSQQLNYLFTPSRMKRLVYLYFQSWNKNCPIIHQPSFDIETAALPTLISVVMMAANYSNLDLEVSTAKSLQDLTELYIFSIQDVCEESEIRHSWRGAKTAALSDMAFENCFAAYLMVCVQFWAGSVISRKRAIERLGVVIKLARQLGLTKVRHELDDSLDEASWIRTECKIRLINIMTLLDCAMCFFANFPCRFTVSEMHFDLPSEEQFFASRHPYSEPNFAHSRNLTVFEAYKSLFENQKPSEGAMTSKEGNPLGLNPMDMFIMIHLLYAYTHAHITQFASLLLNSSPTSGTSTPQNPVHTLSFSESNLTHIKLALARWRSLWSNVRSSIANQAWTKLGFFRNGYNFWLVAQLLINNKDSVEILMGMEVGCEDTLKDLKGLLRDCATDT